MGDDGSVIRVSSACVDLVMGTLIPSLISSKRENRCCGHSNAVSEPNVLL